MSLTGTLGTVAAGVAAAAIAVVSFMSPGDQGSEPVTLTGCVRGGGHPSVYLLRGAAAPAPATPSGETAPMPEDYLLVSIPDTVDLGPMLNHRVAVSGVVSTAKNGPAPPPESNAAERGLKRLAVQSTREVAANCATTGR